MNSTATRLALTAALTFTASSARAIVLFDGVSDVTVHNVATAPHTFMGAAVSLDAGGFSAALNSVSAFDVGLGNVTGTNIVARPVRLNMWLHMTYTPSATATPVFSDQIGTAGTPTFVFDFPSVTLNTGTLVVANLVLASPLVLTPTTGTNIGITLNWQVDNGAGFVSLSGLTTPVHANVPPTVGANLIGASPNFGYYRNASGETNGNFLGTSARNVGPDSGLLLQIHGPDPVPEPTTTVLGAVFGLTLLSRRSRRV